ncbi:glycoside hydrolase family 43 protein [Flavobacterium soli]|uniref:glycoside hydrolase family 43 protein n=1 Tax=Flavobacterium soli TaxID=344881 RepID=UPI00040664AC|nr:glycoside hydrolase 43 family protein [Flavobacterium soli]
MIRKIGFLYTVVVFFNCGNTSQLKAQSVSNETTAYTNPVIWADLPDLSITRSGSDFYLISTTMHLMPGAPVMKSKDLVHWETVSYVFDRLTDNSKYDLLDGTVYGRGQWASSIRHHDGKYYVLFSPNDEPFKSYIFSTDDPSGKWKLVSRTDHFHDASLFFDDDGRVYVFYESGMIRELKSDLSGPKEGGIAMKLFERDAEETGLLEGSQVVKHNGKYYLLMISWPKNGRRRQLCYRADNITGPYEKKVILDDNFAGFSNVAQGCIIDDENGNWYGLVFQDRGGVGRVPTLMPCRWVDGWPMLGDEKGRVPAEGKIPLKAYDNQNGIISSDDFSSEKLNINWQWNHNPVNKAWSLKDRQGYLRLKTSRVVDNIYLAPNTITQRMYGPKCSGTVSLDVSEMKDGDVAGFSAFNGDSGLLSVVAIGDEKYITMSTNVVQLQEKTKAVLSVEVNEMARIPLKDDKVFFRIDADFNLKKDTAQFYYSTDNKNWKPIGQEFKMIFDYRRFFMGTKFAIFNYATKNIGGFVDVDFFEINDTSKIK